MLPILYFDGGSRGNPGEAAGAAVLVMADGQKFTVSEYMPLATNNEAEYTGLIVGLKKAQELGIKELIVKGDSQLVVNQLNGQWKVNSANLKNFYDQAKSLTRKFKKVSINWVRRAENHLADTAVNDCIDQHNKSNKKRKKQELQERDQGTITEGIKTAVSRLVKMGNQAKFKDYMNLKSGRDEFTGKNLAELKKIVPQQIQEYIENKWDGNDKYLAKVYRWYLRGLPPDMAIRKVRTDAEIEAKATGEHPWIEDFSTHSQFKNDLPTDNLFSQKTCHYAKGDIVVISNHNHPLYRQQGVIIKQPEPLNNGKWKITLEIGDNENNIIVKNTDVEDLVVEY